MSLLGADLFALAALTAGGKHPSGAAPPGTPRRLRSQLRAARLCDTAAVGIFFSRLLALNAGGTPALPGSAPRYMSHDVLRAITHSTRCVFDTADASMIPVLWARYSNSIHPRVISHQIASPRHSLNRA
jgi:hypothetical protein